MLQNKAYKYLSLITTFFAVVLLVSNIVSTKILVLGPFTFDGGTLMFPLSYIFGDILTEVYGYKNARKVIWIGFFMLILGQSFDSAPGVSPYASRHSPKIQNQWHNRPRPTPAKQ